jgi:hypothetical protein
MGNNPFLVLLLVVVIAIAAGFLFADNTHLGMRVNIAEVAMKDSVTMLATANAEATAMAATNAAQATYIATMNTVLATQTAQVNACQDEKAAINNDLLNAKKESQKALEGKAHAEATATVANAQARNLATTNVGLNNQVSTLQAENTTLKSHVAQPQPQAAPALTAAGEDQKESNVSSSLIPGSWEPALLPTLGIGLFGAVVFASYRMLKMEDHPERCAHRYSVDADTTYVKMTRQEASRYARSRSKGTN